MATNYPASADNGTTLPNPTSSSTQASPDHASLHSNANDAIKALEAKVGTGASTPVVSTLLFGTGTGTSAWTQLTSAQLAATLSDETGTGSAVFATTPTLVTPKIDTINESTPGNGTTVGGVNIKSGALNTNNSVVTTNITDANVTNPKLQNTGAFNSSWAWASWIPTWTNLTTGNGTTVARYAQIGKVVHARLTFTLGSTSALGAASPTFTLPVAANSNYTVGVTGDVPGIVQLNDTGVSVYTGGVVLSTASIATIYVIGTASAFAGQTNVTTTVPFTWGTTDTISVNLSYEAA
jgi:hypothetical protein